jgi:transposase InsO family protein
MGRFSTRFTHLLKRKNMSHGHSRVRQANDNAHVERFNRTPQDECLRNTIHTLADFQKALQIYILDSPDESNV